MNFYFVNIKKNLFNANSLILIFFFRKVTPTDVLNIEKRLMQPMDMILAKKKRIALSKRGSKAGFTLGATQGIWNMLRSGKDSDSILFNSFP